MHFLQDLLLGNGRIYLLYLFCCSICHIKCIIFIWAMEEQMVNFMIDISPIVL